MILNCKEVADKILDEVKETVDNLLDNGIEPTLAIIRVLGDAASEAYVRSKVKACEQTGINSYVKELEENVSMEEVISIIDDLNTDDTINAILVQLPLPAHLDEEIIVNSIANHKDVDCLSIGSIGSLFTNNDIVQPCTPQGIMSILKANKIDLSGLDVLVINRSMLVGKPLVELLQRENATVQLAHSKTNYMPEKIYESDVVITAVGKEGFIDYKTLLEYDKHFKHLGRKLYIVDVSINRNKEGKLCGDVENNCRADIDKLNSLKNIHITPVPGGVGLTTVASLLQNTIRLTKLQLMIQYKLNKSN